MTKTRAELVAAPRAPDCRWDDAALDAAIAARFPNDPIELTDLIDAWLSDPKLDARTLRECARLICMAANEPEPALRTDPRDALATLRAAVAV